jgi:hypothetical protein
MSSHVPVAASQESADYVCVLCAVQCQTKAAMNKHIASDCKGIHPLQCPTCSKRFANHPRKSEHKKAGCKGPTPLDFSQTDLEAVKLIVMADPSMFQLAELHGVLDAELCRVTHITGPSQNRNVLSVQEKNKSMRVLVGGTSAWIPKKEGLAQILLNNKAIVNDERVSPLFTHNNDSLHVSDKRKAYSLIHSTVHSRGQYPAHAELVKLVPPPRQPRTELQRPRQPGDCNVTRLTRLGSFWWQPAGDIGWKIFSRTGLQ